MQNKINEIFKLWQEHEGAGGQVLVTYKGETIFEKCYGYANIEHQIKMTPDSVFHVASVTKQFTAMCILMLYEWGIVNIYEDVRKYVPDMIQFEQPLSVKQLLNHVSGLREYYDLFYLGGRSMEDHLSQYEAQQIIARQKTLNFEPGTKFLYTNANYMMLATIVERMSGQTFPQFAKKYIFDPLGMENSFVRDNPRMIVPNKVNSYHDNGYEYTNAILTFGLYGGTCLHTTCRDLHKFLHQYLEPTLISRKTMEKIMLDIPEINGKKGNYGCGVRVNDLMGHRYIHHGGVNAGYRTVGAVYPEDELIITAFTNTYNIPIETAARDIARIVLGLPAREKKNLDAYVTDCDDIYHVEGLYFCDKNKDYIQIEVRRDEVYMDGVKATHMGGNLYKQGRLDKAIAFGEPTMMIENGVVMEMRKITEQPDSEQAQAYVGRYYCEDAQGIFDVAYADGKLWLEHFRFPKQELYWFGGDKFFYNHRWITFCRDAAGKVTGYLFNSGHLTDVPFEKIR